MKPTLDDLLREMVIRYMKSCIECISKDLDKPEEHARLLLFVYDIYGKNVVGEISIRGTEVTIHRHCKISDPPHYYMMFNILEKDDTDVFFCFQCIFTDYTRDISELGLSYKSVKVL